jgi:hypothetical protein
MPLREASERDLDDIIMLIKALAEYEKVRKKDHLHNQ